MTEPRRTTREDITRAINDLVGTAEAANRLGVTPTAIRKMRHEGGLPHFRITGGPVVYYTEDLDAIVRLANHQHLSIAASARAITGVIQGYR